MKYFYFLSAVTASTPTTSTTIMMRSEDVRMTDNFFVNSFFGFLYMNANSRRVA